MSKYNSPFIAGSAHSEMDKAVDAHFSSASSRTEPGVAGGKGYEKWGDSRWNNTDVSAEFFNNETGVNYKHNGAKGDYPRG